MEDSYLVTYGVQTPDPLTNRDSSPVVKAYITELAKKPTSIKSTIESQCP